jgi:hypothetical protein
VAVFPRGKGEGGTHHAGADDRDGALRGRGVAGGVVAHGYSGFYIQDLSLLLMAGLFLCVPRAILMVRFYLTTDYTDYHG